MDNLDILDAKVGIPSPSLDLDGWRRLSIPAWRRILIESGNGGDKHRENYARWMLTEVLEVTEAAEVINES